MDVSSISTVGDAEPPPRPPPPPSPTEVWSVGATLRLLHGRNKESGWSGFGPSTIHMCTLNIREVIRIRVVSMLSHLGKQLAIIVQISLKKKGMQSYVSIFSHFGLLDGHSFTATIDGILIYAVMKPMQPASRARSKFIHGI